MEEKRNDEPAFPRDERYMGHNGMTLRDYFAGQALPGLVDPTSRIDWYPEACKRAYAYADAMLKARALPHAHDKGQDNDRSI